MGSANQKNVAWTAGQRSKPVTVHAMVLVPLDPNDPQPRRDDERFGGDYKAFRKADKAWSERERNRRKRLRVAEPLSAAAQTEEPVNTEPTEPPTVEPPTAQPSTAEPTVKLIAKPHGRVPRMASGEPCQWDAVRGCWCDSAGNAWDRVAEAAAAKEAHATAERAARRRIIRLIDAQALQQLSGDAFANCCPSCHQPVLCVMSDGTTARCRRACCAHVCAHCGVPRASCTLGPIVVMELQMDEQVVPGCGRWTTTHPLEQLSGYDEFAAQLQELTGERCAGIWRSGDRSKALRIRRNLAYFDVACALLEADGRVPYGEFDRCLASVLRTQAELLVSRRVRAVVAMKVHAESERTRREREEVARRDAEYARREAMRKARAEQEEIERLQRLQESALARRSEPGSIVVGVRVRAGNKPNPEYTRNHLHLCAWRDHNRGAIKPTVTTVHLRFDVFRVE